jgi:hypothetical protein
METKVCPKCRKEYPLTDFYKNKRSHGGDGRSYYCKFCDRAVHKQNYENRKEGICEKRRKRYASKKDQISLFQSFRPTSGPRCACGKSLYPYEYHLGKCLKCARSGIIQHRESVPTHQPAARVGGGD